MVAVYPVLCQRMEEAGVTYRELAKAADMTLFSFCLKIWGIRRWNLTEVLNICCFFRTPDAEHLFVRKHIKSQFLESQGKNNDV